MSEARKPSCPGCAAKDAEIVRLQEQLAKAQKNSGNSSKPPSSDIVDPKKKERADADDDGEPKRRIGGQPGHAAHFRKLFEGLNINATVVHALTCCPDCGGAVRRNGTIVHRHQQVEVVLPQLNVTEHQCPDYW